MMLTDGYYNGVNPGTGSVSSGGTNDADAKSITTITGTTPAGAALSFSYNGSTKPYAKSSTTGEIADIAMHYWVTDLRPDLLNNVPKSVSTVSPYLNNDSFWQNMGFYAITLGIDGTLPQTNATLDAIVAGSKTWPNPPSGGNDNKTVDDLWHATVNARGRLLNAKNADELSDGVEGMLAEINKVASSQSGVATSAPDIKVISEGYSYKYTPSYTTGSWIGNVASYKLDPTSSAATCINWQVEGSIVTLGDTNVGALQPLPRCAYVTSGVTSGVNTTYNGIAASGSRAIVAWNTSGYGNFDSNNSFVTGKIPGGTTTALIDYLRGDRTNEAPNGTAKYRPRERVLGDIVNSMPTFIKGVLNSRFDQLPAGTPGKDTYIAFLATKAAREGVLFTGANDGMLHGFRDGKSDVDSSGKPTGTGFTDGGKEVFAFVPRAALPTMNQLASKGYDHLYFVDGPTVEADAFLPSVALGISTWTNMLLGTTGAGSTSMYAINVDNPTALTASSVRWEITPTDRSYGSTLYTSADYKDLGNILSDVQTGITMDNRWVAVFGNGYHGTGDTMAHLYIADLATGAMIAKITAGSDTNNGLGGVILVKDSKQRIIGAYAGDLKGSMWKFDLSGTSSSDWRVGLGGSPLFKTTTTPIKPITAAPTLVAHPKGGAMVVFGTGKLFDAVPDDRNNTDTESVYGVWDSEPFGSTSTPAEVAQIAQIDRTNLVQQTITTTPFKGGTATLPQDYFAVSNNTVDFSTTPVLATNNKRGWYMNLTQTTGQRAIYPITTLIGRYAAVDTMAPVTAVSSNPCTVVGQGKAWNYAIDMITGGGAGATDPIFDTNGDGVVDSKDALVSGYENLADGRTRYVKNDTRSTGILQTGYGSGFSYVENPVTHTFTTKVDSVSSSNNGKVTVIDSLSGTSGAGGGEIGRAGNSGTFIDCKAQINGCTAGGAVKRTWRQLYMR
jgi:type IV pilus assembly protein PilY1